MPRSPVIPPELLARSRRIRGRSGIGERLVYIFLGLFILPHTLVGIGFLLAMPAGIAWALAGQDHVAVVERLWSTMGKKSRSYHAAYAYDLSSSRERRRSEATLPPALYQALEAAAPSARTVTVRALGAGSLLIYDDVIEGSADIWRKVGLLWLMGIFLGGIMSLFAYAIYVSPWMTRRLYRNGVAVPGTILSKRSTSSSKTGATSYHLTYQFTTPDGRPWKREMVAHSTTHGENAEVRQPVTVLYDPNRPTRSIAYEYGPYLCVPT